MPEAAAAEAAAEELATTTEMQEVSCIPVSCDGITIDSGTICCWSDPILGWYLAQDSTLCFDYIQ